MTATDDKPASNPARPAQARLGEELPVFCERCGYSLHGLPMTRCEHCDILQFACPECGHHQPINTLRPAVQRVLGRIRAAALVVIVLIKLNFFGWAMVAWFGMGVSWLYHYPNDKRFVVRELDLEVWVSFVALAIPYGLIGRMLVLRWRRGLTVGVVLAALQLLAITLGALVFRWSEPSLPADSLWTSADYWLLIGWSCATTLVGAVAVWPIWAGLVRVLLPRQAGRTLLEWQHSEGGDRPLSRLARE